MGKKSKRKEIIAMTKIELALHLTLEMIRHGNCCPPASGVESAANAAAEMFNTIYGKLNVE